MMKISTHNDWDNLKEVIVGKADGAQIPLIDISTRNFCFTDNRMDELEKLHGPFPNWLIDGANEDISIFVDTLEKLGIKVYRPEDLDNKKNISTPNWVSQGWYTWCPRDLLLPLNNLMIEAPSPTRARYFETQAYHQIMLAAIKDGVEWISAPKPILKDELFSSIESPTERLRNLEPVFDAANIIRLGQDILYQISNTGNLLGYMWLKNLLEPRGYNLHLAKDVYRYSHIDTTIIPIRPGLVLLNSSRVSAKNCPKIFDKWDKIFFNSVSDKINPISQYFSKNYLPASKYIGLNLFSINQNTVCVDRDESDLIKTLESYKINCIPLPMRFSRELMGGFHCITLDLVREGVLESYLY